MSARRRREEVRRQREEAQVVAEVDRAAEAAKIEQQV